MNSLNRSQGLPAGRHGNIVEKVIRDKDGKLIRARFFVYENGGRIKARLLDFVYLAEQALLNGTNFLLATVSKAKSKVSVKNNVFLQPTTYNLSTIFTIGSKPRAPTF